MPEYISVKEAAGLWKVSERSVTGFCSSGKIAGAVKEGRDWSIPADAEKPADGRVKTGAYKKHNRKTAELLPLPVGVSDYKLASTEYYYVDKTMMIKDFIDERPMVSLFTRPRRFGKTLNMDMLRTFFEKSDEDTSIYFKNRKIWQCGEKYRSYQGRFPVIFISFKDVKYGTWEETLEEISNIFSREFKRHDELVTNEIREAAGTNYYEKIVSKTASTVELAHALEYLSEMLHKYYNECVIVIIDEYDTPIEQGYAKGFYDNVIAFMRNLLSGCFKDNRHLAYGFMTGILRVAKESIFSGLNNIVINSVLDGKYSKYFGFTGEEVSEMAAYYGRLDKMDELCEWYDGYRFGSTEIFNPWSVVNYFSNDCMPRAFWLSTGSNAIIGEILSEADEEIWQKLTSLVNGGKFATYIDTSVIYPQVHRNPSTIYSFLLVAGYLKVVKSEISVNGDFICEVALPNREISSVYRKEILQKFEPMIPQSSAIAIQEAIFSGDDAKLKNCIQELLIHSVSSFDTAKENFYHGFMLGICALLGGVYTTSNRESGEGRYDIQLLPAAAVGNNKKMPDTKRSGVTLPGIIIELKAEKNCSAERLKTLADNALRQITEKKYDAEMRARGVDVIYKYGVAFSGKNVEVVVS